MRISEPNRGTVSSSPLNLNFDCPQSCSIRNEPKVEVEIRKHTEASEPKESKESKEGEMSEPEVEKNITEEEEDAAEIEKKKYEKTQK